MTTIPSVVKPSAAWRAESFWISGISSRHGWHHVAQRLTSVSFAPPHVRRTAFPSRSVTVAGAILSPGASATPIEGGAWELSACGVGRATTGLAMAAVVAATATIAATAAPTGTGKRLTALRKIETVAGNGTRTRD